MLLAHERSREATAFKFLKIVNSQQKGTTVMDETRFDKIEIKELEILPTMVSIRKKMYLDKNLLFLPPSLPTHVRPG